MRYRFNRRLPILFLLLAYVFGLLWLELATSPRSGAECAGLLDTAQLTGLASDYQTAESFCGRIY